MMKPSNTQQSSFDKKSMELMMKSLVGKSSFSVIESPSNNVMLLEFDNFIGQCVEHTTNIPFFEVYDLRSPAKYIHIIDGSLRKRNSDNSGFSYYSNGVKYGIKVNEDKSIDCYLLGINPVFFDQILSPYQSDKFLPQFQKEIQCQSIQGSISYLKFLIKQSFDQLDYVEDDFNRLRIEQELSFLFGLISRKHISMQRCPFDVRQTQRIIEYFEEKVKENKFFHTEELIIDLSIEYYLDWLESFQKTFKKAPLQYYMDRRLEVVNESDNYKMPLSKFKELLELIHELATSDENSPLRQEWNSSSFKETPPLIPFLQNKLGYSKGQRDSQKFSQSLFKEYCTDIKITTAKQYYDFLRIEHTKYLLLKTKKSIVEIVVSCGYRDPKHFTEHFKKWTKGMEPEEFRYKYKKTAIYYT